MTLRRSSTRPAKSRSNWTSAKTAVSSIVSSHPYFVATAASAVAMAASAFVNERLAAAAERRNPPKGKFVRVKGLRLHYVEQGKGEPLVLLHGNGSMIQDFVSSGLIQTASKAYRVIAFDRPGYGHSERPRNRIWTAKAQAEVIQAALRKIGVSKAIVLGHSWGCSVAVALALKSPKSVKALVLVRVTITPLCVRTWSRCRDLQYQYLEILSGTHFRPCSAASCGRSSPGRSSGLRRCRKNSRRASQRR